jgi:hypothetical protein
MASITAIARTFFTACETGKGWEVCVKQDASLAQEVLSTADSKTFSHTSTGRTAYK